MTQSPPNHPVKMQVIQRDVLPILKTITVEGKKYNLGQLQEFRKHPILSTFIPEVSRLSMSWVKLKNGETLEAHQHPTSSMIIVCEGEGEVVGDCHQPLQAGDMVIVPPRSKHGFIGRGKSGFWALSVQFEGLGLYEDREAPRVHFVEGSSGKYPSIEALLREQAEQEKKFKKNPLMKLVHSPDSKKPEVKARLLEALNYWSDWFQKLLAARISVGGKMEFSEAAQQHMQEEIGHNKILFHLRKDNPITFWDPLLDSAASWFYHQMLTGSDEEKTVLMHLVLEGASTQFHTEAKELFPDSHFFEMHSTLDEDHFEMGCRLLATSSKLDIPHLLTVLQHGWSVFNVLAAQMAFYALGKKSSISSK
jgi:quercetin dioxygenase-like cupin family protein